MLHISKVDAVKAELAAIAGVSLDDGPRGVALHRRDPWSVSERA